MRIVLTSTDTLAYGACRMTYHYGSALKAAGHEVSVLYERGSGTADDSILPAMDAAGIEAERVPNLRRAAIPFQGGELIEAVKRRRPDAVISTQLGDASAAMRAARKLGLQSVLFAQNLPRFTGKGILGPGLKRRIYARAVRSAGRVLCVAPGIEAEMASVMGADPARVRTVLNGLDLEDGQWAKAPTDEERAEASRGLREEFGLADGERLIVNLARIHPQKGLDTLADAAAAMKADPDCPPFKIVVAGDIGDEGGRPHKDALLEQIKRLGLEDTLLLPGFRKDGPRLLKGADLYLLSSRWEGLPLVVLEAMAARLPVVMTQYGVRFAGYEDGVHGWYTPVGDAPAMARAAAAALRLPEAELRNVGDAGRRYLEENLTLAAGKRRFVAQVEGLLAGDES